MRSPGSSRGSSMSLIRLSPDSQYLPAIVTFSSAFASGSLATIASYSEP